MKGILLAAILPTICLVMAIYKTYNLPYESSKNIKYYIQGWAWEFIAAVTVSCGFYYAGSSKYFEIIGAFSLAAACLLSLEGICRNVKYCESDRNLL